MITPAALARNTSSEAGRLPEILVTGSEGLIGTALRRPLRERGYTVRPMDIRCSAGTSGHGDIMDAGQIRRRIVGCRGIVHLAAVSRVAWGERDPARCCSTNVTGTANVLSAAEASQSRPWVLFASSREVYGEPMRLPVREDDALRPMNTYARSKMEGERLVIEGGLRGLQTAIVRLSNVYGSPSDHADRVIPAFCRGAVEARNLRVDGSNHTFDFTHVDDVACGIMALIEALEAGERKVSTVHLVSGQATTLGELAAMANEAGGHRSRIVEGPARQYDVARFVGDPTLAKRLLHWQTSIPLAEGIRRLTQAFAEQVAGVRG